MRIVWTTSSGADPRLCRAFPQARADAVVSAVVDGVPVYVTATDVHYDGDCARPDTHDCAATAVQVWDAATGELVRTIHDAGGTHLVATAVHGRPVAVTCDWSATPKLIDLESGVVLGEITGHRDVVQGLATVALDDGPAVVSAGWDQSIRITHLTTDEVRVIDTGERLNAVSAMAVGGRAVAVAAGDVIGLWDLEAGVRIGSLPAASKTRKIATWPGGHALVALLSFDGDVEVWDTASGTRVNCRMAGHRMAHDIAGVVAADGRCLLALSDHETVRLWDVDADRSAGLPMVGPTSWCALTTDGPGTVVTASGTDEAIGVWRVGSETRHPGAGDGAGHTSTIQCIAVAPGGHVIAGGTDGTIGSWRLKDGMREPMVGALPAPVRAVVATPVGGGAAVLAGGGDLHGAPDGELHRWSDSGPDQPVIVDHRGEVRIVVIADLDGRPVVLTAGCDATLHITDLATADRVGDIPGRHQPDGIAVGDLRGRPVVAVSRAFGPFQLWDLAGRVPVATPVTDAIDVLERVHAFAQLDEGPAIVTVRHHVVRIRNLGTGATWHLDPDNDDAVTALAVHSLGRPLAAVARTDGSVSLLDLVARTVVDVLALPYPATALAWAPDGDLIVACRRDLLRVSR
ncbi:WD40 repeat domain-containing protein [Actinoallomurus sp. CA-150999]|uniref:WD40 repeat domain-containing protein n=1 Tax=Actinoallomurus sp. CA-150999 TaxID=3239887 RepID=UPI003D92A4FA